MSYGCDVCGAPATHHYNFASCSSDGSPPARPAPSPISLCDEHAKEFDAKRAEQMLEQFRETLAVAAHLAQTPESVTFFYMAENPRSSEALQRLLRQKSGTVTAEGVRDSDNVDISCETPVPPDVAMKEWFDWLARTIRMPGCKFAGWGLDPRKVH